MAPKALHALLVGGLCALVLLSYAASQGNLLRSAPGSGRAALEAERARLIDELKSHRLTIDRLNRLNADLTSRCTAADKAAAPAAARQVASSSSSSYIHTTTSLPASPGDLLMMTYATGGVREMLQNWVLHVQRLWLPVLVAAMDADTVNQCTSQRFDCLDWSHTATRADQQYVRGSFSGFRALGVRKIDALLPVLRAGVHVVLSDVDCVWSASPVPMFHGRLAGYEDFAHADVLVATDCMSPEQDEAGSGCYGDTVDKNTGVIAVRATAAGIATMAEWRVRLSVGQNDEQDQTTFNDLLDGNGRGHRWGMSHAQKSAFYGFAEKWCGGRKVRRGFNKVWEAGASEGTAPGAGALAPRHVPDSRRVFAVCLPNATRRAIVGVFPITAVSGGHTFFIQQLQSPTASWPMAVHATYQFGDQPDYPFGKRQRFRDWGLWLVPDEEQRLAAGVSGSATNYLVLDDDAPPAPAAEWKGFSDLHVRGRQHVHHLERTRQRLATAFALARALNRTVVLPRLWCYCDKFWHRLDRCAIPSAVTAQPLPFVCPMDHVFEPTGLHGTLQSRRARPRKGMLAERVDGPWEDGLPYRGSHWLHTLGSHPSVGYSKAALRASVRASEPARQPAGGEPPADPAAISSALLRTTRTKPSDPKPSNPAAAADGARAPKHTFVPGREGPDITLAAGQTDAQLRGALAAYGHVRLLTVTLTDAARLLRCYERRSAAADMKRLAEIIFVHEWCYRPFEMTAEWLAVERKGKPPRGKEPWCVWGYKLPTTPPHCHS